MITNSGAINVSKSPLLKDPTLTRFHYNALSIIDAVTAQTFFRFKIVQRSIFVQLPVLFPFMAVAFSQLDFVFVENFSAKIFLEQYL